MTRGKQMTIQKVKRSVSVFFLLLCTGCSEIPAVFRPASISAKVTSELIQTVFIISAIGFVVVESILLFTVFKYRSADNSKEIPPQIEGNRRLEIIWTTAVTVILAVIFIISLNPLWIISYPPASKSGASSTENLNIQVIGRQWYWEFDYLDYQVNTANELHIPVGVPVMFELVSADVIHSFWVPELSGKIDVIPGHTNRIWIQAEKPGIYEGQCAEFCGVEHAHMRMLVIAESKEQFEAWLLHQQTVPKADLTSDETEGELLFLSGSCSSCHSIKGTEADGTQGPDLTHFASRTTFAGGSFQNTPENISKWLKNPQEMKPGNQMPNLGLSDNDIRLLQAYLENLK